ncbi:MAG: hypothetical protein RLZZ148_3001 [Cyanobacteriota bacterium]
MSKVISVMTVFIMALGMMNLIGDRSPTIACEPTRRDSDDSKGKPRPTPPPSPSFSPVAS